MLIHKLNNIVFGYKINDDDAEWLRALLVNHDEITTLRTQRDELQHDLDFAYKRAKVLADMLAIPVHESPEVTGTILGLVRSKVERVLNQQNELVEALKPFAQFHCDDATCDCYNCIASKLLTKIKEQP